VAPWLLVIDDHVLPTADAAPGGFVTSPDTLLDHTVVAVGPMPSA
jgi:hypothetical protein